MSTDPEKGQGPTIDNNVNHSTEPNGSSGGPGEVAEHHGVQWPTYDQEDVQRAVDRFLGRGRPSISIVTGIKNILHSWVNLLLVFLPIAWVSHFKSHGEEHEWNPIITFVLCFVAIIPLERMFDYAGGQMSHYLGHGLGSLLIITLNNAVEATLAIILLLKCELKLLQSTIMGVILLHLLLVPGMSFFTEGARVVSQELDQDITEMNHTLLTMGILSFLIPAAFFSALNGKQALENPVSEIVRSNLLNISRGMAIILIVVYICSRIYLHNPPGEDNSLRVRENSPKQLKDLEKKLTEEAPEANVWTLLIILFIALGLMATTAEFLVESVEFVRKDREEFFGLVILPMVSFSGDAALSIGHYLRHLWQQFFGGGRAKATIAKAQSIDLSIQFSILIMPFLILLGWWTKREFILLFNTFEVAMLIGACFLVNYVTADKRTNWVEGLILVAFYTMIVLCAWYFTGETAIDTFNAACNAAVGEAVREE